MTLCALGGKYIFRAVLGCALLAGVLVMASAARTKAGAGHTSSAPGPDYISALGTANRFLQAWQNHDQETGLLLLSDAAKRHTSADNLETFFSARQTAYEITRGRKLKPNRYCFSIVLFAEHAGGRIRPRYAQLVVLKTGRDDWAIDNLPSQ